jgi:RNA polymerase sigma factor (sigma-70 family)
MKTNLVTLRQPAKAEPALCDEAVALACVGGDPAAVAELFDRFRLAVARSAGRRSRLAGARRLVDDETEPPPDGALDARRRLDALRRALASLRDERREAFVLCELEGLSAREASEALGVAETAIWKRVSDARRALRAELTRGQ